MSVERGASALGNGQQLTRAGVERRGSPARLPCGTPVSPPLQVRAPAKWGSSEMRGRSSQGRGLAGCPAVFQPPPNREDRRTPPSNQPPTPLETLDLAEGGEGGFDPPSNQPLPPFETLPQPEEREKPPLSPASPGALPRLRHQHRILIGASAALPGPCDARPGLESHDDRRPLRSLAAVFVLFSSLIIPNFGAFV